jgi:hypothetical protein
MNVIVVNVYGDVVHMMFHLVVVAVIVMVVVLFVKMDGVLMELNVTPWTSGMG